MHVVCRALVLIRLDERSPMPDAVQFFDRDGGPELYERVAPAAGLGVRLPLEHGASTLVTLSESTAFAALLHEAVEIERIPLRLTVDHIQVINGR